MAAESRHRAARCALLVCAAVLLSPALPAAEEQIFEPGSKHVCVPAASGEGWDCRSAEDGGAAPADAAKPAREPRLRSSSEIPDEAQTAAAPAAAAATAAPTDPNPARSAPAASPSSSAAPAEGPRRLPSYLLSPEAQAAPAAAARPAAAAPAASPPPRSATAPATAAAPAPAPVQATAAAPAPPPAAADVTAPASSDSTAPAAAASTRTTTAPAETTARTTEPPAAAAATSAAATPTAAPSAPPAASAAATAQEPAPARTAPLANLLGGSEFRRLADGRFVLELASGGDRGQVEDTAGGLSLARGEIYLLPLQREGAPWFVAVWGDFDSVDAARAARDEAAAAGATPGWPRRVGPLKQELR